MPPIQNPFREQNRFTFTSFIKVGIVVWSVGSLLMAFYFTPDHIHNDPTSHDMVLDTNTNTNTNTNLSSVTHATNADTKDHAIVSSKAKAKTIAYAVSFIKCGDRQTSSAGLTDASLVLRHSIHKISSRNPSSGSNYDYKMYAIVHTQAKECSAVLKDVGFEIVIVDPPIAQNEIQMEGYLRKNIHREWCCGHDEFVKLYAYTLPEEVIVHVDIDYAFFKPMDHLFDAMFYDKDSPEGQAARGKLELERPGERLPDQIGAFITRDWGQVAPGKFPPAYQAGFLVARRDPSVMKEALDIVRQGNYTKGWGMGYGWHGSGHGGYVGAMAMQGLMAYYYDYVRKDNAVELNHCRHNHMGMDVLYRSHPNYMPQRVEKKLVGGCRNSLEYCEDCQVTDFDKIYSVHYTMCRKPWQCISEGSKSGTTAAGKKGRAIPTEVVNIEHCYMLNRHWHDLRLDLERKLFALTGDETILEGSTYDYKKDLFLGHCSEDGNAGYHMIAGKDETFKRVGELYD